jgi:hypothetical protein
LSKSFRMCRSIVLLLGGTMLAAAGFAQSTTQTTSQNSGSNAQKLPPPPTIDVNVNQNETLSAVRYDNKYEVYGGLGFAHLKSGPELFEGANLGGFDVQGTYWLWGHLGATANVRGYYGTQGVNPNQYGVKGPFVFQHMFLGGATYRLIAREHAALSVHGMVGGADGVFSHGLGTSPLNPSYTVQPRDVGMYNDGLGLASTIGGSLDLNRSPRLALRISPDWIMTRYGGYDTPTNVPSTFATHSQNEFGISVGILYRFKMGKGPRYH